jgi:hypothetical protein
MAPRADAQTNVDVAYEVIYVRKPRRRLLFRLRDSMLNLWLAGSAAGRSKLAAGKTVATGLGTPRVTLPTEEYIVAGLDDLAPHGGRFSSQSAATAALDAAVAGNPRLVGKLQVVSSFEVAA